MKTYEWNGKYGRQYRIEAGPHLSRRDQPGADWHLESIGIPALETVEELGRVAERLAEVEQRLSVLTGRLLAALGIEMDGLGERAEGAILAAIEEEKRRAVREALEAVRADIVGQIETCDMDDESGLALARQIIDDRRRLADGGTDPEKLPCAKT